jgi:UDP-N-acetyl-D-mannosaminuronic acid transferase (WecB/TagA/CpsF family)
VRVALGLVNAPPELWVKLRMEWAWRIIKEPRRLSGRYASASLGFAAAVLSDVLSPENARA